jgi:phosphoglycolate phosphatase-like HAD superfamily hydrolase
LIDLAWEEGRVRIIRGLLFDLDGTLIDSKERFYQSYVQALGDFDLPAITREEFERHYHLDELSHRLPQGAALRADFWRRFLENLTASDHETQTAIPGVTNALFRLREQGYAMAVATARLCPESSVRRELEALGMLAYFDNVLSHARIAEREGEEKAASTNKRTIIEEGAALLGLPTSQTAFIGDWVADIRSAREAGCGLTVAVLSSGFKPEILRAERPDALLHSAAELPGLLASIPELIGPGYLALDREGRWLNDGMEITHTRTVEAFWRGLTRDERGRYVVRIGREECPVHLHATPYFVRQVEVSSEEILLWLSDGETESLDPATLALVEERYLHCSVKGGRHEARFNRPAYYELALRLEQDPAGRGYFLPHGGKRYRLRIR